MKRDLTCRNPECKKLRVSTLHKGFCPTCYAWWLLDTETGKEYRQKMIIKSKPIGRAEKTKRKRAEMGPTEYRSSVLQPIVNEIARLIDYGQPCIATGNFGKMNGGHYYTQKAHSQIALNLHNIHIQSFESNHHKSGDEGRYVEGLIKIYGSDYAMFVLDLKRVYLHTVISKQEMEEAYPKVLRVRNWLKNRKRKWSATDRIRLRNMVNEYLGLYNTRFETS